MAIEDFVRNHVAAFNAHDAGGWTNNYSANASLYDPQYPEPVKGRDAVRKDIEDFFKAFPDMKFTIEEVVSSDQSAAVRGLGEGTHMGPMEGPAGTIQPTNKRVQVAFASFIRLGSDGKIAEERRYYDQAGMLMQLGLMQ